jgi:PKD repeat protein
MKRIITLRSLFFTCLALVISHLAFAQGISFTASTTSGCGPLAVTFTNTSTNNSAYLYYWSFGDGSPTLVDTSSTSVSHQFMNSGHYFVNVYVYDANSNFVGSYNLNNSIEVIKPKINLVADTVCPGDLVQFSVTGGYFNSYAWSLGNGSTSNLANPSLTYSTVGQKTIVLTTTNTANSCGSQTVIKKIFITNSIIPQPEISSDIFISSCPSVPIQFYTNNKFSSYSWSFGDGGTGNTENPTHTYTSPGTNTVVLTVTNNCSQSNTVFYTAEISNTPPPFPNSIKLTADQKLICPNTNVSFYASYGYDKYVWDFGDGSAIVTSNTSYNYHTYGNTTGTYIASATVTSPCGNDSTLYDTIVVSNTVPFPQNISYNLNVNPSPSCPNTSIGFNAPHGFKTYLWSFGDGTEQTTNNNYTYYSYSYDSISKTYPVSVKMTNNCGDDTTLYNSIVITNDITFPNQSGFSLTINPSTACPNSDISFQVPSGYNKYVWSFGDNISYTSQNSNENHRYTSIGTYTVNVTITNGCGKDTTLVGTVEIKNNVGFPNNNFSVYHNPNPACPNDIVQFNAPSGYDYYEWNFGDGSLVEVKSHNSNSHKFTGTNSTYIVSLKIKNGCGQQIILKDTVLINNNIGFGNYESLNIFPNMSVFCPGTNVNFNAPGGFASYEWNFGDGSGLEHSSSSNFNHLYGNQVDTFTVSVKITNGCLNDTTLYTNVQANNNLGFPTEDWFSVNANPNPSCPNDKVSFDAPGGYNKYKWYFGDNDSITSSQSYVQHSYTTDGMYSYSVKIENACGNDITLFGQININTSSSNNNNNNNNLFVYSSNSNGAACPNELIEFEVNQDGYANYNWYFGNTNSGFDTVITNTNTVQHSFSNIGTHTIICKIINGCGDTIQGQKTVQIVNNNPIGNNLSINASPSPSCPGDEVFFNIEDGLLTNEYVWNFGDSFPTITTIGTGISHIYDSTGVKTISVLATNTCGSSTTLNYTHSVGSGNAPVLQNENGSPNWGAISDGGGNNATVGCAGDVVVFYFMGAAMQNVWTFGDGTSGSASETISVGGEDGSVVATIIKHVFPANGEYTIGLTLTNGCGLSTTDSMKINIGGGLAVDGDMITSSPPFTTCAPIDFIAFGGESYTWNFGDSSVITTSSPTVSYTYPNPGIYLASVVITNGCGNTATYSKSIQVSQGTGPQVALVSSFPPNCAGASNGLAIVTASGAVAPYTYLWNDANAQTTETATDLSAGSYNVSVKDKIGCESVFALSITDPEPIVVVTSTTPSSCSGSTGTANATVISGGTAPYIYYWSPSAATTAGIIDLSSGTYTVTVNDNNGCQVSNTAIVSDLNSGTVGVDSIVNVGCAGSASGAIFIDLTGFNTYTYAWSNGATTQDITGLTAGTYSVQISGANNCQAAYSATVEEASPISVAVVSTIEPTCGNFDGVASALVTGGSAPYSYIWDSSTGNQTTDAATGLPAGSYSVIVNDAQGCSDSSFIDLSNSNAPIISAVKLNATCNGNTDGAINISVTGGTSPYLYTWNVAPPQTNTQDLTGLSAGNYLVLVNDAQGCVSVRTYAVTQPAALIVNATATTATCNANNATATANVTGGTAPYNYLWNLSDTTQSVDSLAIGSYTVTVVDDNGCSASDNTTITTSVPTPSICMVTVDEFSVNNEIYWDKTAYMNVDSFIVYRAISTGDFRRIGAVDYNSFSMLTDTARSVGLGLSNGDPNAAAYQYKLQIRDECGNYSEKSLYHNTIHIDFNENTGTFSWQQPYKIEDAVLSPVANYILICDTTNNLNPWFQVGATAGDQSSVTDVYFNDHKDHPDVVWRVKTDWTIECEATRAPINTTRSNIKKPSALIGVENIAKIENNISVYPNPANDNLTIELVAVSGVNKVCIVNALGQLMYADTIQGLGTKVKKQINTSAYPKGIYSVVLENGKQRTVKKLVIN